MWQDIPHDAIFAGYYMCIGCERMYYIDLSMPDTYLMCHPLWVDPNVPYPNGPVPVPTTPPAPGTPGTPGTSGTPGTPNGATDPAAALLSAGVATSNNGN